MMHPQMQMQYARGQQGNQGQLGHMNQQQNEMAAPACPPGTLPPGTPVALERTRAVVERFLAEGGFAHVYLVSVAGDSSSFCVLKRIACPDDAALEGLRTEVHVHRLVSGHKNIVRFIDSCISPLASGGYEVLILMEFCEGGHLVDFLNTRLETRLSEDEIIRIFSDVCEAVAHMHALTPPIAHRDIKVENVLISSNGTCKLCDFGSTTTRTVPAGASISAHEIRRLEEEVGRVTTLQYRAPELCDLYQKRGMNEKVDTWALGILLYKLCFFTTPFEDGGKLAILNVKYTMPTYPVYSGKLRGLITALLEPHVAKRFNVFQAFAVVCEMRKVPYSLPVPPVASKIDTYRLSSSNSLMGDDASEGHVNAGSVGNIVSVGNINVQNVTPMRRGRPQKASAPGVAGGPSDSSMISMADLGAAFSTSASSSFDQQTQPFEQSGSPFGSGHAALATAFGMPQLIPSGANNGNMFGFAQPQSALLASPSFDANLVHSTYSATGFSLSGMHDRSLQQQNMAPTFANTTSDAVLWSVHPTPSATTHFSAPATPAAGIEAATINAAFGGAPSMIPANTRTRGFSSAGHGDLISPGISIQSTTTTLSPMQSPSSAAISQAFQSPGAGMMIAPVPVPRQQSSVGGGSGTMTLSQIRPVSWAGVTQTTNGQASAGFNHQPYSSGMPPAMNAGTSDAASRFAGPANPTTSAFSPQHVQHNPFAPFQQQPQQQQRFAPQTHTAIMPPPASSTMMPMTSTSSNPIATQSRHMSLQPGFGSRPVSGPDWFGSFAPALQQPMQQNIGGFGMHPGTMSGQQQQQQQSLQQQSSHAPPKPPRAGRLSIT